MKKMKLEIELVPDSCHYINLRSILKQSEWRKLRSIIIPKLDNKCEICSGHSYGRSLDLHEVWSYNDGVQKLERLEGLCVFCHEVRHFYLAKIRGHEKRARERLKKINGLNDLEVFEYEQEVHRNYLINSSREWDIDISLLEKYNI